MRLAALAAVALALGGCDGIDCAGTTDNNCQARYAQAKLARPFGGVSVEHDGARGVTCWVRDSQNAGLSCLPDWMLTGPSKASAELQNCTTATKSEPCIDANGEMWPGNAPEARR